MPDHTPIPKDPIKTKTASPVPAPIEEPIEEPITIEEPVEDNKQD